jgi:hypothetical protein
MDKILRVEVHDDLRRLLELQTAYVRMRGQHKPREGWGGAL